MRRPRRWSGHAQLRMTSRGRGRVPEGALERITSGLLRPASARSLAGSVRGHHRAAERTGRGGLHGGSGPRASTSSLSRDVAERSFRSARVRGRHGATRRRSRGPGAEPENLLVAAEATWRRSGRNNGRSSPACATAGRARPASSTACLAAGALPIVETRAWSRALEGRTSRVARAAARRVGNGRRRAWNGEVAIPFDGALEVCPVDQPRGYGDGFGAPRYAGGFTCTRAWTSSPAGDADPRAVRSDRPTRARTRWAATSCSCRRAVARVQRPPEPATARSRTAPCRPAT